MIGFIMDEDRQEDFETLKEYLEIEYGDMVEIWTFQPKKSECEEKVMFLCPQCNDFVKAKGKVTRVSNKPKKIEKLDYNFMDGDSTDIKMAKKINELIDDRNNSL